MDASVVRRVFGYFLREYGALLALALLCSFFSVTTLTEQHPSGVAAARQVAGQIGSGANVIVAAQGHVQDAEFADALLELLTERGASVVGAVKGEPRDARQALVRIVESGKRVDFIATSQSAATWLVFADLARDFPALASARLVKPQSYRWPNFLKTDNLLNIANQIAVIAIVAIGMTMVIITGGIDLSVGSLIALSAVVSCLLIERAGGGIGATSVAMSLSCCVGIAVCGFAGLFSGLMVAGCRIPPFIVTLAMMLVASGLAYRLTGGNSAYLVPDSFVWLGRGTTLAGLPNAVAGMLLLYAAAHLLMSRTVAGRYLYAIGGNVEAARLSGIPVRRVLLFAYGVSGLLAGLGGVIMASQLKSGSPTYGQMYELYVIAAVVVGGTSLAGGQGNMLGTLVGAFLIAVIQNGMNLTNVESYTQKIVLGAVILAAVLLDKVKRWNGQ